MTTRERLFDLDRAKGLGIFLVVLGHIVARDNPLGVSWYAALKTQIYLFHMPFFMFVSGAIAGYAWKPLTSWKEYGTFVKKRAERLLPAYFLFALIVFVGKVLAQKMAGHVDNPVTSLWSFFDVVLQALAKV
jgi:fucose 4-O-acetylase-like acetyltransferase